MADIEQRSSNHARAVCDRVVHLPSEILSNILSRLPIITILRCKIVCKTWYSLTKDPHFVNMLLTRTNCQRVQLVLLQVSLNRLMLVDSEGCKVGEIPLGVMEGWSPFIMGSCNGMVCLATTRKLDPAAVWNPMTCDYLILPESKSVRPVLHHFLGIGFDLVIKRYKVVRVYYDSHGSHSFTFEIITLGESSWRHLDTPSGILEIGTGAAVFVDGYFSWIIISEEVQGCDGIQILSLDIVEEKFQTLSLLPVVKFPLSEPEGIDLSLLYSEGFLTLTAFGQRVPGKRRSRRGYQLMHLWKLMMNNVVGLQINCQRAQKLYLPRDLYCSELICEGISGSYLLKTSNGHNGLQKLVKYLTTRGKHMDLDLPESTHISTFVPSLIYPSRALLGLL